MGHREPMSVLRPESASIPDAPGAYLFRDSDGRAVYVGKALSLRKRLASYWGRPLHPRTEAMMEQAAAVEWIVATSEVDALMLEYNLIKSHRPRFNVRYRDDKSYPYLALTVGEQWPRARVMRGPRRKDVRYFGPYGHAYAIRETLDALTRVFPVRTCSNAPPSCATSCSPPARPSRARKWSWRRKRTSTSSAWRKMTSKQRCRSSSSGGGG